MGINNVEVLKGDDTPPVHIWGSELNRTLCGLKGKITSTDSKHWATCEACLSIQKTKEANSS